ncbi:Sterol 3-beta-glucosyltransferase [Quaeritorhiza haematococci]|nr:Sterol 3-beta-glucosyltransferase [Quaeritorhiza haematococci]
MTATGASELDTATTSPSLMMGAGTAGQDSNTKWWDLFGRNNVVMGDGAPMNNAFFQFVQAAVEETNTDDTFSSPPKPSAPSNPLSADDRSSIHELFVPYPSSSSSHSTTPLPSQQRRGNKSKSNQNRKRVPTVGEEPAHLTDLINETTKESDDGSRTTTESGLKVDGEDTGTTVGLTTTTTSSANAPASTNTIPAASRPTATATSGSGTLATTDSASLYASSGYDSAGEWSYSSEDDEHDEGTPNQGGEDEDEDDKDDGVDDEDGEGDDERRGSVVGGVGRELTRDQKIQIYFELPEVEKYHGAHMLKGYMYLTEGHVCFQSKIPKDQGVNQKSGFLKKRTRYGVRKQYVTYWFVLRDDMVKFFENSTNIYYPISGFHLKHVKSIEPAPSAKRPFLFKVVTGQNDGEKTYYLQADTEIAMQEWIRTMKASAFRAKNEGEDVKIVLPYANISEIELNRASPNTDTVRLKVVDDELLITEEYYFVFFSLAKECYDALQRLHVAHKSTLPLSLPRRRSMYDTASFSGALPPKPLDSPRLLPAPITTTISTTSAFLTSPDDPNLSGTSPASQGSSSPSSPRMSVKGNGSGSLNGTPKQGRRANGKVMHKRSRSDFQKAAMGAGVVGAVVGGISPLTPPSLSPPVVTPGSALNSSDVENAPKVAEARKDGLQEEIYSLFSKHVPTNPNVTISVVPDTPTAALSVFSPSNTGMAQTIQQQTTPVICGKPPLSPSASHLMGLSAIAGSQQPQPQPNAKATSPERKQWVWSSPRRHRKTMSDVTDLQKQQLQTELRQHVLIHQHHKSPLAAEDAIGTGGSGGEKTWEPVSNIPPIISTSASDAIQVPQQRPLSPSFPPTAPSPATLSTSPEKKGAFPTSWGWSPRHRKTISDVTSDWQQIQQHMQHQQQKADDFRNLFALPDTENLIALYISDNHLSFKSKVVGIKTKALVPLQDIQKIKKDKTSGMFHYGLSVVTKDQNEIIFEFHSSEARNRCFDVLALKVNTMRPHQHTRGQHGVDSVAGQGPVSPSRASSTFPDHQISSLEDLEHQSPQTTSTGNTRLPSSTSSARIDVGGISTPSTPTPSAIPQNPSEADLLSKMLPLLSDPIPASSPLSKKPMHITCLTIGTRGDVQPYIALCKGLMRHSGGLHRVRIATHLEYKEWIEGHGIEFREVKGNPAQLIQLCVDNGMFTYSFVREGLSKFRGWVDELLQSAWEACQDTDLLIESPTAMGGVHVAEKLQIPFFAAFPMPWTRTRTYPHPFAVPERHLGGGYNYMTHVMIEQMFWLGTCAQINRWRKRTLERPPINLNQGGNIAFEHKLPFLYSFSPSVVPPPADWNSWIHTTGYWFLDNPEHSWNPPASLMKFLEEDEGEEVEQSESQNKAVNSGKTRRKPIVYIGFGSIVVPDPEGMTRIIIEAVKKAGVKAILSKGWSARLPKTVTKATKAETSSTNPVSAVAGKDTDSNSGTGSKTVLNGVRTTGESDQSSPSSATTTAEQTSPTPHTSSNNISNGAVSTEPAITPQQHASEFAEYSSFIYPLDKVPHDWLFPKVDAVVHHGGAGTTAAGIRAGVPTIIKPFFGDQFFWGDRLQELGVGCVVRKLTADKLASALVTATTDTKMREKAKALGTRIRAESGVEEAIRFIYKNVEYSASRVKKLAENVNSSVSSLVSSTISSAPASSAVIISDSSANTSNTSLIPSIMSDTDNRSATGGRPASSPSQSEHFPTPSNSSSTKPSLSPEKTTFTNTLKGIVRRKSVSGYTSPNRKITENTENTQTKSQPDGNSRNSTVASGGGRVGKGVTKSEDLTLNREKQDDDVHMKRAASASATVTLAGTDSGQNLVVPSLAVNARKESTLVS